MVAASTGTKVTGTASTSMYTDAAVEDSCQGNSMSWIICTGTGAAAMDSCQTVRYSKYKYRNRHISLGRLSGTACLTLYRQAANTGTKSTNKGTGAAFEDGY